METEQEIAQNEIDNGNFEAEQTMKRVGIPSLVIGFVVAIMLHFNMISLMPTLTIVGLLAAICLITKFSLSTDSADEKVSTGSNQGLVLLAFSFGLIIFILFTLLMSLWVVNKILDMNFNFWIGFILAIANLALWIVWTTNCFDNKLEGAILVQLKLNGKYVKWGKNMRPSSWGICKVTPFVGWLEGKLEDFSEKTMQITHEAFKDKDSKNLEDGVAVDVKVDDGSGTNFPVVVKFEATIRVRDTYIIAKTEDGIKGAKKQLVPKIFGGLVTVLNQARDKENVKPKTVEGFEPIRTGLSDKATKLMLTDFNKLGFDLDAFNLTAVEPTTVEEKSRAEARAAVAKAKGENEAETVKVKGAFQNIQEQVRDVKMSPEVTSGIVLAILGDTHREDTSITTGSGSGKSGKKGSSSSAQSDIARAMLFGAVTDNHHKHGGNGDNGAD